MSLLIGFLTFILVLNCLLLMLLVLIQLPKKEAGAGIAFGGAATDALFGAGSGNALTKMTKYAATTFMGLALSLSLLNSHAARKSNRLLDAELQKAASASAPIVPPPAPTNALTLAPTQALQLPPALEATNLLQSAPAPSNALLTVPNQPGAVSTQAVTIQPAPAATPAATNAPARPPK